MATLQEATEIIDDYPNLEWIPGNPITDGYDNKDTTVERTENEAEYEYINGSSRINNIGR